MPKPRSRTYCDHGSNRASLGAIVLLTGCLLTAGCSGFSARGLNAEGVRQFEQARYQEAIGHFQQAIFNDPNNADAYYNLAAAHHRLATLHKNPSDYERAESYYNQCLDRNSDHAECYRGLAVLLAEQGRKDESLRLVRGWVDRRPDWAEPKIELARLLEENDQPELAKERLLEALVQEPNHARALAALGNLREAHGDRVQALADYQRSLWYNRFQPEVAARVAALQSPGMTTAGALEVSPGGMQTATTNTTTAR